MSGGEVVYSGWLRKSPPEKKLRRYAWKKRWFVLRSGRLTGDPDVLEYYKNDHAKKPIRVIDLNLCDQVDAGLTFKRKEFGHSFIFDIKTFDRIFYLVADTEDEMNKWVRHICDICGFNPTDEDAAKAGPQSVVDIPPHPILGNVAGQTALVLPNVPPPYQPVSVRQLEPQSSSEVQDYLWLANCESKKPEPNSSVECLPPSEENHQEYLLLEECESKTPQASFYSQDTVLLPKSASSPTTHPDGGDASELYVFNTPIRKASVETQIRNLSVSYDIPPTPGSNSTYQVPRTLSTSTTLGSYESDVVPPPRPPKPSLSSSSGLPPPPAERSPTDTYCVPRSAAEIDGNYCVPTSAGNKNSRSNTMESLRRHKDFGSQDCYDIPRSYSSETSVSDLNESFNSYFKKKGFMPLESHSMEEGEQNYVPMSVNSPSHQHSTSLPESMHDTNYVPMTPNTMEFSSLGKQVPPPAHMGFRSSPKTPPRRPALGECQQPPPVDRNLKPDRKVKPAPLEIKPLPEWEETCTPVRSPVTRSFAREFPIPIPARPPSVHSTASSTDSEDFGEPYVDMDPNMHPDDPMKMTAPLTAPMPADGGSSPMMKPKGDKLVEYLDLDLEAGKSTPPRKKKSNGFGSTASDERVDYVTVDQQRTQALKSTREAWSEDRQLTETDTSSKVLK
uniref:GRB2-associated binding protein 1 n=1 Tax=Nothobranchius kadleci TaxID=1051664 RepID=A0A1A8CA32_NOTKA